MPGAFAYVCAVVEPSFINSEEKIDKVVGRRTPMPDALKTGMQLQSLATELHQSFKHRWKANGVFRFKTHEEADEWMITMLAQSQIPQS